METFKPAEFSAGTFEKASKRFHLMQLPSSTTMLQSQMVLPLSTTLPSTIDYFNTILHQVLQKYRDVASYRNDMHGSIEEFERIVLQIAISIVQRYHTKNRTRFRRIKLLAREMHTIFMRKCKRRATTTTCQNSFNASIKKSSRSAPESVAAPEEKRGGGRGGNNKQTDAKTKFVAVTESSSLTSEDNGLAVNPRWRMPGAKHTLDINVKVNVGPTTIK